MSERQYIKLIDLQLPGLYDCRRLPEFDARTDGVPLSSLSDGVTFQDYYQPDSRLTRIPTPAPPLDNFPRVHDTPEVRQQLLRWGGAFVRQTRKNLYIQTGLLEPSSDHQPDIKALFAAYWGLALRPTEDDDTFECLPVACSLINHDTIGYIEPSLQGDGLVYRGAIVLPSTPAQAYPAAAPRQSGQYSLS